MGQQQLILLVLATVIVGIAIVVGIRAFSENSIKSNSDALIQDMVRIANDAQAWKQKPAPFGGQADGAAKESISDYTGVTMNALGYADTLDALTYNNLNGWYVIAPGDPLTITACNGLKDNQAILEVRGIDDRSIVQTGILLGEYTAACP